MATNKYWQDRFTMLQESQLNKGERHMHDLDEQFMKANAAVQRKIEMWYARFAANNQITLAEAKKMLSGRDLKEFKWDVKDYIKYGEENAMNQQWMKELENASARVHISRLEALKLQMQQEIEVLYGNHLDGTDKLMKRIFDDGYYHTAFEIQRGFNVGYDIHGYNSNQLRSVISKPWTTDGRTFSDRIWSHKQELIGRVHTGLTQAVIRGDSPQDLIKSISKQFGVKQNQAARLVMTESAFFASVAQQQCFKDLGVERYEIVATLDRRTSEVCQDLDGHVFDMKDFEVGSTAPPFHVWCRTCTVPYFDDLGGERAARDADGNTYYVPSDMKYHDWKKTFVDGGSKDNLNPIGVGAIIKALTLEERIQKVKDDIAANGGTITEDHLHDAGKAVRDELMSKRTDLKVEFERIKTELAEFDDANDRDALSAEYSKYSSARRRLRTLEEVGVGSYEELEKILSDIEQRRDDIESKRDGITKRLRSARSAYEKNWKENAQELKDTISRIRPVGRGSNDLNNHLERSRSPMKSVVMDAYDYYPEEWVTKSVKRGTLTPKKVDRGYYSDFRGEIAISGYSEGSQINTAIHELGHRMERAVPEIKKAEKVFYDRRTAGETLQWLGGSYARDEKSRFDKFLHKYMGKDYGGDAYELVSMGFQMSYLEPVAMWADEDMADWIYGILMLL